MNTHRTRYLVDTRSTKTLTLILLLAASIVSASLVFPTSLHAELEPGPCEWGLAHCAQDALYLQILSDYMVNCLIGYAFCKKYIEG